MKVGDQIYTPDGRGVVLEIDGTDVKVARIKANGEKVELYYDLSVLHKVPTQDDLETQASLTFRRAHPEFNPVAANVKLMTDYVRAHFHEWTAENLEAAFITLKSRLAPLPAVQTATPAPAVTAAPAAITPATPVAITPTAPAFRLTKQQVRDASKDQMKEWMADKPAGALAALEALGIRTKLPVRWRQ
jgi:hypothetical protein